MTSPGEQSPLDAALVAVIDKIPPVVLAVMRKVEDPTKLSDDDLRHYWNGAISALEWLLEIRDRHVTRP